MGGVAPVPCDPAPPRIHGLSGGVSIIWRRMVASLSSSNLPRLCEGPFGAEKTPLGLAFSIFNLRRSLSSSTSCRPRFTPALLPKPELDSWKFELFWLALGLSLGRSLSLSREEGPEDRSSVMVTARHWQ